MDAMTEPLWKRLDLVNLSVWTVISVFLLLFWLGVWRVAQALWQMLQ